VASSTTQIANLALGKIGQARIENISTDTDEPARWANEFYGQARDYVTEAGLWRHARKTMVLEEGANDRPNDYVYAYSRPSDCLKFCYLLPYTGPFDPRYTIRFETEGDYIYCDEPQARGVYLRQVTDVTKYPPSFVDALAWYLAHLLVTPLRVENSLIGLTLQGFNAAFNHAAAIGDTERLVIWTAEEAMADFHRAR